MATARSGSSICTCPLLSVHGPQGCPWQGWGLQVPRQDDGTGWQQRPSRTAPAVQSLGDIGTRRTDPEKGERHLFGGSKVLQGSSTGCTSLRQQDMEPHKSRTRAARGIPCSSCLPHGTSSQAKAGGWEQMGIPQDVWCFRGVWHGNKPALHPEVPVDYSDIYCKSPRSWSMPTGGTQAWFATKEVVVEAGNRLGHQQCNWIRWKITDLALTQALLVWRRSCLDMADYLVLVEDGSQSLSNDTLTGRGEVPGGWKQGGAIVCL